MSGHGTSPAFRTSTSGSLSSTSGGAVVDSSSLFGMVSRMGAGRSPGRPFSRLLPPKQAHHIPIEFTGSGSEYFRIWIVNLLLIMLTLGIYYPWAKVRKLRYFHGNTSIAGHALDFHGEPRKMLRGSMLAGILFALYSQALEYSATAGLVGALLVSAIWPVLLRSAMQFRLANTSWRGLRLSFAGNTGGAYKAVAVPLLLSLLPLALGAYGDTDDARITEWDLLKAIGLSWLVLLLSLPYFYWRLKKYQHDHYRLGQLQTELRLDPGAVYGVALRTLGLALVVPVVFAGLAFLSMGAAGKASAAGVAIAILMTLLSFAWLSCSAAACGFRSSCWATCRCACRTFSGPRPAIATCGFAASSCSGPISACS